MNKKWIYSLLIIAILLLGFKLRYHDLNTWPRLGATFDEYAWTWQGMNIIQKGVPISWSPHSQYSNAKNIYYQKVHFRIVTPFLEHPPLFGMVAGSFALLNGAQDMYHLSISNIRPLAVFLGILSILFLYLLTFELYGGRIAFISSLLYATIPTIVVGSRIVQNENFFIPMWILALWMVSKYIKEKKSIYRNAAALICFLLVLAKIPWIAAAGSIFLIFLYLNRWRDALVFLLLPILSLIVFGIYGFYYDSRLFLSLWGLQLNRYDISFTSIFALFQKPYLVDRFMTDGWIYFGWFAFMILLLKDFKKNYFIIFALLSYFVIFLAGIPDEPGHGWYRYPLYPFLVISIALFIKEYFAKNWVLTFMFLTIVGTTLFGNTWEKVLGFSYLVFRVIIFGWGLVLVPQLYKSKITDRFGKVISYSWIFLFILMNIWAVLLYNEQ